MTGGSSTAWTAGHTYAPVSPGLWVTSMPGWARTEFVPHGQCENVHLGGHVQTGGYGQLGRSFSLFGDHVISIELFDHDGKFQEVTRNSDPEMFHALLGGSPGSLSVITHFTIQAYRDKNYVRSRGLKALHRPFHTPLLVSVPHCVLWLPGIRTCRVPGRCSCCRDRREEHAGEYAGEHVNAGPLKLP
jgi:hypothetical protein